MLDPPVIVAIILPLLLYVPGYVLSRAIPGALPNDALELHFERVVSSTLLNGWLALLLAELGIFSLWSHLAFVGLACVFIFVLGLRFASTGVHAASEHRTTSRACTLKDVATSDSLWFGLALLIALVLVLPPFEVILGVRDAGVYSNTGFALARTGGLVQHDALLAELGQAANDPDPAVRGPAEQAMSNFLGVQHPERFIATRMRAAGFFINEGDAPRGLVTPQGFHLFPVWVGLLTSMLGVVGGLFAPGLMATLGAWSMGMLGRRLAGRWTGLLALLFLALNSVQVWFGRYSTSETTTQFLTFAGLYYFARWQQQRPHLPEYVNRKDHKDRKDQAVEQLERPDESSDREHTSTPNAHITASYYAALAGIAFGQFALTRIDFFLVVGPVLLYLLYCWLAHHWQRGHTALALGLGTMLVHAGLHVIFISRAYFFDTAYARLQDYAITAYTALPFITPLLREVYHTRTGSPFKDPMRLWQELAVVATGVGVLLAIWRWPQPLHAIERLVRRWRTVALTSVALLIVGLSGYNYLIRPNILTLDVLAAIPNCLTPQQMANPQGACLTLQGYVGAPVAIPVPQQVPDPLLLKEENPVAYYDAGLIALLSHMENDHPHYAEVEAARQRLPELVHEIDATANAATPDSDLTRQRDALLAQLDDISRSVINFSFDELCQLNIPTPKIDDKYVIPRANFVRVGWYLFPLGIALGVLGFALWVWRGMDRASWLFLVIGLVGTFFYIRQTYGTSDQTYIYILRRFVPIAYPAFSLGMAYALTCRVLPHSENLNRKGRRGRKGRAIGQFVGYCSTEQGLDREEPFSFLKSLRSLRSLRFNDVLGFVIAVARWGLAVGMIAFFVWTGWPIYRHVEYAGAVNQIARMAAQFEPNDVLLFRGGGPTYGHFRDVPDLVTTPLHFMYGLDALTVKSSQPAAYAGALADQVRHWHAQGRSVYMVLSASGGDAMLPGFGLVPAGDAVLSLPEFEQLTNQKPRNVSTLRLPLAIYRLQANDSQIAGTLPLPLTATDVAAQVRGFYLSEPYVTSTGADADSSAGNTETPVVPFDSYAWTDGDALLRLRWDEQSPPDTLELYLAGGLRPVHLGPAEVCLSLVADRLPLPQADGADNTVPLGCRSIGDAMQPHEVVLDPQAVASLTAVAPGRVLLRIESTAWVPAEEDPRQIDQRSVGVQFGGVAE